MPLPKYDQFMSHAGQIYGRCDEIGIRLVEDLNENSNKNEREFKYNAFGISCEFFMDLGKTILFTVGDGVGILECSS